MKSCDDFHDYMHYDMGKETCCFCGISLRPQENREEESCVIHEEQDGGRVCVTHGEHHGYGHIDEYIAGRE